jgi:beta-lactamase superfamily II metal-dependent hydrolase
VLSVGQGSAYGPLSSSLVTQYSVDGVRLLQTDHDGAVTKTVPRKLG